MSAQYTQLNNKLRLKNQCSGFTLIEVLVALFIFAILSILTLFAIRSLIETYQRLRVINVELTQLELAVSQMRIDFTQIIDRSILDEDGAALSPLQVYSRNHIEFSTASLANPAAIEKHGTLQRVAFAQVGHSLVRYTWLVLDRPPHVDTQVHVILKHVQTVAFTYINSNGGLVNAIAPGIIPRAVVVTITLMNGQIWQGIFPNVSYGNAG